MTYSVFPFLKKSEHISDDKAGCEALRRDLGISVLGDRFEFNIPPEGAEYIHQYEETSAFLQELVTLFHCIKMEMGYTIYHRFMRKDYERLQYSE